MIFIYEIIILNIFKYLNLPLWCVCFYFISFLNCDKYLLYENRRYCYKKGCILSWRQNYIRIDYFKFIELCFEKCTNFKNSIKKNIF